MSTRTWYMKTRTAWILTSYTTNFKSTLKSNLVFKKQFLHILKTTLISRKLEFSQVNNNHNVSLVTYEWFYSFFFESFFNLLLYGVNINFVCFSPKLVFEWIILFDLTQNQVQLNIRDSSILHCIWRQIADCKVFFLTDWNCFLMLQFDFFFYNLPEL